jgi:hypothetical protein
MSDAFRKFPQKYAREYAALGFYITQCSAVEASLHLFLRKLLGIAEPIERLLVGEPRIVDLLELVRKAAHLKEMDEKRFGVLTNLLTLVNQNNKIRQVVAHKAGSAEPDGTLIFHNAPSAKSVASMYIYSCTPEELENQAILLVEITLVLALLGDSRVHGHPSFAKQVTERLASLESTPRPAIPNPPPPPKLPKQPRQPKPSQP